jgi:hypothetical protein
MAQHLETRALVKHYINICNTALTQRGDEFPYKQVITLMDQFFSGETLTIKVEGAEGQSTEYFTTRFIHGEFTPIQTGVHDPDAQLSLQRSYLEEVMEHADDYIRRPERLDWSWITQQLSPFGKSGK